MPEQKESAVQILRLLRTVIINIVMVLLLGLGAIFTACAQNSPPQASDTGSVSPGSEDATQTIVKLEQQRRTALLKADVKTLDRLTAAGYTQIGPDGEVVSKAQLLAAIESGELRFQAIDYEGVQIRVTGDAVLVTSHSKVKGHCRGKDISGTYEFSRVYEKRHGGWEVALQRDSRSQVGLVGADAAGAAAEDARPPASRKR